MTEMAVSFAIGQLLSLLSEEVNVLRGVHKEFADIKDELESIQAFLKDADRRASIEGENIGDGVKTWVKQVREAAFRIQDVIDEYMIYVAQQPRNIKCLDVLYKISCLIQILNPPHRIAFEIQDIKSYVRGIEERSERYDFKIQPSFQQGSQNAKIWHNSRMAALYMEEDEIVGFEAPKHALINWLVKGRAERTVISIVGMGGQGKTTLAKNVFDNKKVSGNFDCRVWITVSHSYNVEGLLRDMLLKFYKQKEDGLLKDIFQMDRASLIDEVRNYLQQKRYVVVFDDVWSVHFWDDIEFAVIDNRKGSKILITTRNMNVAMSCKKSSFVEVHELQPLSIEQSLELFNKKAFRSDIDVCCLKEFTSISLEIVQKCKGLPLAIVVIGGLLSTKEKNMVEWRRFSETLSYELKKDSHLIEIKEILGFSYDDLPPHYLKSCLLYFGIYPEDYEVNSNRLIRQWIAEGFVKEEVGKTLEEVAQGYLTELFRRSLVQVSSIRIDEKAKTCRVHDLIRLMILEKVEDLTFSHEISEDDQSSLSGTIRRLSIMSNSNCLMEDIESSHVRSILVFIDYDSSKNFARKITTKYKLLKVLDFEAAKLHHVPKDIGKLIHLRYLSFKKNLEIKELPKSIGLLQNLETLDVRLTDVTDIPKEIGKLKKLRHLMGTRISLIQLKDGIGGLKSLQTLNNVWLDEDGAGKIIRELGKLKLLRDLRLFCVEVEHKSDLSSSINEMQNLEKLVISFSVLNEVVDLHLILPLSTLQNLSLFVKLEKLPEWIPKLQNLVNLELSYSELIDDPLESLKNMQNLLSLSMQRYAYNGESLHFQDGGFQKLKELKLDSMNYLNFILIDKGTLHVLKRLELWDIPQLKTVPTGIQHLEKLQVLSFGNMSTEFDDSIAPLRGNEHWLIERRNA